MSKKKINWQEQLSDLENKWKRALADYANLEKRIENEKKSFVKYSNLRLLEKLLPILDDLEKAEKHLRDTGLTLICSRLGQVLISEGVEVMDVLNKNFDPELMDAVEIVEGPKNKVMEVVSKGYLLNGKVLRVAKVKVGGKELNKEVKKELEKEKARGDYM